MQYRAIYFVPNSGLTTEPGTPNIPSHSSVRYFFLQINNDFTTGEYGPTVYIVIIVILAAVIAAMAVVMIR